MVLFPFNWSSAEQQYGSVAKPTNGVHQRSPIIKNMQTMHEHYSHLLHQWSTFAYNQFRSLDGRLYSVCSIRKFVASSLSLSATPATGHQIRWRQPYSAHRNHAHCLCTYECVRDGFFFFSFSFLILSSLGLFLFAELLSQCGASKRRENV